MILQDGNNRTLGLQVLEAELTTDGSGDGSATLPVETGRLLALEVESSGGAAFDAGADWTVSGSRSGTILTKADDAAWLVRVRTAVQGADGADLESAYEAPMLLREALTFTVAAGGASKTGTVRAYVMRGLA